MTFSRCGAMVFALWAVATGACRPKEPTPQEPDRAPGPRRSPPQYVQVKGGVGAIRQVVLFTDSLAAVGGGLEIRSISVLQSDSAVLPIDYETVLELRSGELWTIADGKRVDRSAGDMWLAPRGSRLTLHLLTEHAVLRAISLIK